MEVTQLAEDLGFKSCLCTYLCDFEQSLYLSQPLSLSVKWGTCHSQGLL